MPRQIPGVSNLNSFPGTLYQVLSALCLHLVCSSGAAGHLLPPKPSPCLTPLRVPGSPARRASLLCQMFPQVNSMEHQPPKRQPWKKETTDSPSLRHNIRTWPVNGSEKSCRKDTSFPLLNSTAPKHVNHKYALSTEPLLTTSI